MGTRRVGDIWGISGSSVPINPIKYIFRGDRDT